MTHQHGHTHAPEPDTTYNWRIHHPFGEDGDEVAIEVAPQRGLMPRWRFVLPSNFDGITRWGTGAPAPGSASEEEQDVAVDEDVHGVAHGGPVQLVNGPEVIWFGGLEPLSSKKSAYLVFRGDPPHYVAFGQSEDPEGPPGSLEGISFGDHPTHPAPGGHSH